MIGEEKNVYSHDSCISYSYEIEFLLTERATEFHKKSKI